MEHQEKFTPWRIKEKEFQVKNSGQNVQKIMEIIRKKRTEISVG